MTFKSDPTEANYINFKRLQATKKYIIRNERRISWIKLCEQFNRSTPISLIWTYMRKFNKSYFPPTHSNSDYSWIFDFLKKYTPDTVEPAFNLDSFCHTLPNQNFTIKSFTIVELNSAISSRRDSTPGLDYISYKMLKHLSSQSKLVLLDILNLLWEHNLIPMDWKVDCLVPILKPNKDKSNFDSYRPIALTSCMGKIFEQLLKQRLEHFIESNHILPSNQFGFRRGRSSRESIAHLHLDIYNAKQSNEAFAGVFFDIVGAFNNVNHHILSKELAAIGLPVKFIQWIFNFLHSRKVFVKYNNRLIGPRLSHRGTCQGSILSPLIFTLYIHRLNLVLGSHIYNLQFADDLVVYCSSNNITTLNFRLNEALVKLNSYFKYLALDINFEKSKVIVFNKVGSEKIKINYNNIALPITNEIKFLGVIFMNNLSWNKYVDHIINRAPNALNILKSLAKTYWGSDPKILLTLYKSLVRSHFEYGFFCFSSNDKLVNKLNIVQNHGLRLITGAMKTTPINSLQVECNIPPLHLRFKYLKFCFLLKFFSISNHPLIKKLNYLYSKYPVNAPLTSNNPFILFEYSFMLNLNNQQKIHSSSNWMCYEKEFDCLINQIDIIIDHTLKDRQEVYNLIAQFSKFKQVYTDASKNDIKVSMAYYVPHLKFGQGARLKKELSIFSAEALAITAALEFIKKQSDKFWLIITDSMSVLKALDNYQFSANTNFIILEIRHLLYQLSRRNYNIKLLWTPSHIGVKGNEHVDFLARSIVDSDSGSPVDENVAVPYTDLLSVIKLKILSDWSDLWRQTLLRKGSWYAQINQDIGKSPWFTKSHRFRSRKYYSILNRLRFGHCRFNAHLNRMRIISSPVCPHCSNNSTQTLDHIFFECSAFNLERLLFIANLLSTSGSENVPRNTQDLLTNINNYNSIFEYICNTINDR